MRTRGPIGLVRSWFGVAAAAIVLCSAAWLTAEYLRAVRVVSAEKATIASLQERARTDATIHATLLQPEFDRQREALGRRLKAYRRGGLLLLISLGAFMVWIKWLKPGPGEWAGVPRWLVTRIEALAVTRDDIVAGLARRPKRKVKKAELGATRSEATKRLSLAEKKALIHYRVLDSCSGCTVCAQVCPLDAIEARPYLRHEINHDRCTRCGLCVPACPEQAIEVI